MSTSRNWPGGLKKAWDVPWDSGSVLCSACPAWSWAIANNWENGCSGPTVLFDALTKTKMELWSQAVALCNWCGDVLTSERWKVRRNKIQVLSVECHLLCFVFLMTVENGYPGPAWWFHMEAEAGGEANLGYTVRLTHYTKLILYLIYIFSHLLCIYFCAWVWVHACGNQNHL